MGAFETNNSAREKKKELVNILIDSVYYLDLDLAERHRLLRFLMESYFNVPAHNKQEDE